MADPADNAAANRSLEDLDAYYRTNPPLIVTKSPEAISKKRPVQFLEQENSELSKTEAELVRQHVAVDLDKAE